MTGLWTIVDCRTGERATAAAFNTAHSARDQIDAWRRRPAHVRPDCREQLAFLEPEPLEESCHLRPMGREQGCK